MTLLWIVLVAGVILYFIMRSVRSDDGVDDIKYGSGDRPKDRFEIRSNIRTEPNTNSWMEGERAQKIAGIKYYQGSIERVQVGDIVYLQAEPDNLYDANAVMITHKGNCIGYIPANAAPYYKKKLDSGEALSAEIVGIHHGYYKRPFFQIRE
jgi:hypothetical protein